jgi:hypothetical protein
MDAQPCPFAAREGNQASMSIEPLDMAHAPGAPIETLESWFSAHGWPCERLGDEEIVSSAKGAWCQYELRGLWREDDCVLQFLAFPDVKVTDAQASSNYETIGLINEQLWLGHFEYWPATGIIIYRHAVLLDSGNGEATFSYEQAEVMVEAAIDELDRFYPVFQFVLWGGKSPREAITSAMVETQGEA